MSPFRFAVWLLRYGLEPRILYKPLCQTDIIEGYGTA